MEQEVAGACRRWFRRRSSAGSDTPGRRGQPWTDGQQALVIEEPTAVGLAGFQAGRRGESTVDFVGSRRTVDRCWVDQRAGR